MAILILESMSEFYPHNWSIMELFTYKGIAEGKYVEGEIEALNQDEASHKLKEQKVIITNLIKGKKKKTEAKDKGKKSSFSLFGGKKKAKTEDAAAKPAEKK